MGGSLLLSIKTDPAPEQFAQSLGVRDSRPACVCPASAHTSNVQERASPVCLLEKVDRLKDPPHLSPTKWISGLGRVAPPRLGLLDSAYVT